MKLNLVPTYVNEGKKTRGAFVVSALMVVASIFVFIFLTNTSQSELKKERDNALSIKPGADEALAESQYADKVISEARQVILNINLADAMKKHSTVYPDLYDSIMPFVPSFYRLTSMSATPTGADACVVSLSGYLESQQQYADLMLALRRIPGVTVVTRNGYNYDGMFVPPLTEVDQYGKPRKRSDAPIPDDPQQRLEYFIGQGTVSGYSGEGGFGDPSTNQKGGMPGSHLVSVTIQLPKNIQTPNPRASLAASGGGGGTNTPGTNPAPGTGGGQPAADNDR